MFKISLDHCFTHFANFAKTGTCMQKWQRDKVASTLSPVRFRVGDFSTAVSSGLEGSPEKGEGGSCRAGSRRRRALESAVTGLRRPDAAASGCAGGRPVAMSCRDVPPESVVGGGRTQRGGVIRRRGRRRSRWSRRLGPAGTETKRCLLPWMPSSFVKRKAKFCSW